MYVRTYVCTRCVLATLGSRLHCLYYPSSGACYWFMLGCSVSTGQGRSSDLNNVCICTGNVWQCLYERKRAMCDVVVVRLSCNFPMNTDELKCVHV